MNLDPAKLLVILVVALVVLGPERLPRAARQVGAVWRELARIRDQVTDEVRSAFPTEDLPKIPKIPNPSRAISGFLSGLGEPTATAGATNAPGEQQAEDGAAVDSGGPPQAAPQGPPTPTAAFGFDDVSMN